MQVQKIENTNFGSRNKTIRFADDIARRVNTCYPRISSTLIDNMNNAPLHQELIERLNTRINEVLREDIYYGFDDAETLIGKILAITKPIRKEKVGNCGESAMLAEIIAKINGIKNCYIASLKTAKGKNLDHSVLYVNDKQPYIIDAWLGIADYVPNMIQRFKNEFMHHFDAKESDELVFKKLKNDYTACLNKPFSRRQINKLKRIYSSHVIRRRYLCE